MENFIVMLVSFVLGNYMKIDYREVSDLNKYFR
jgi:hypothetical protein